MDDDSGLGLNAQITFTPTESDTYYVTLRGDILDTPFNGNWYTNPGSYIITIEDLTPIDDFADNTFLDISDK